MYTEKPQYWWRAKKDDDIASILFQHVSTLEERQAGQFWKDRVHESIYQNRALDSSGGYSQALALLRSSGFTAARLNVVRSIVDTLTAKIGKNRPAIKVKPDDVDWSYKRKARQLDKFLAGKMDFLDVDEVAPMVLRDCLIARAGCCKVGKAFGEIVLDRVPVEEVFVDAREARYGKPRQMHHRMQFAREVLAEQFPKHKQAIMDAAPAEFRPGDGSLEESDMTNMVDVLESWHLRSGPDAKDGKHVICIREQVLLPPEPYNDDTFPIKVIRYSPQRRGYWGISLVEILGEIQWKINETVMDIQKAIYFGSQLRVWIRKGTNVPGRHLGRTRGPTYHEYEGSQPPKFDPPNPVSKDQMQFLQMLIDQAYELSGVSQLSAQAKNPLGAGASGVALDTMYDIESERYAMTELGYAKFHVELGDAMIDRAKEIDADPVTKGYTAKWSSRTLMQRIKWSDVDMEKDQFKLQLEPTNFMPQTRAGKLQAAEQLSKAGVVVGPWVSSLLGGFPDIERANKTRNAPLEYLEFIMEQLEDVDVPFDTLTPNSYMDLALGFEIGKATLNRLAPEPNVPEDVLKRFMDWLQLAEGILNKAAPAEAEMPPGMPQPGGVGLAPEAPGALPPGPAPETLPGEALPGVMPPPVQ